MPDECNFVRDPTSDQRCDPDLTRRRALARLGLLAIGAYVAPSVLTISQARASSGGSNASVPTPPTPPTAPSDVDELERDDVAKDHCKDAPRPGGNGNPTISQRDFERASEAVEAGFAKPLNEIWGDIVSQYPGRVVAVEFTGFRWRPRYRLKAISKSGRLETVIVSARTGLIERIVGC